MAFLASVLFKQPVLFSLQTEPFYLLRWYVAWKLWGAASRLMAGLYDTCLRSSVSPSVGSLVHPSQVSRTARHGAKQCERPSWVVYMVSSSVQLDLDSLSAVLAACVHWADHRARHFRCCSSFRAVCSNTFHCEDLTTCFRASFLTGWPYWYGENFSELLQC